MPPARPNLMYVTGSRNRRDDESSSIASYGFSMHAIWLKHQASGPAAMEFVDGLKCDSV